MIVATPEANEVDTSLGTPLVVQCRLTEASPESVDDRAREMVRKLRELLRWEGFRESACGDDEGFYFIIEGAGEIAIHYNRVEPEPALHARPSRRREPGLLEFCSALAERGFALTLFLSARTSVLHVRHD